MAPISGSEFYYENQPEQAPQNANPIQGKLNNEVITIDAKGAISKKLVGVDYDVVNDFRQNKSVTHSGGINVNTAFLPITIFMVVIPTPLPSYSRHESQLRTAVTTKVVHTSAILREKRVFDGGSSLTTKNLAWDAETGEVLLTQTANEYNDKYYNFSYPAYWAYSGMSQAAKNLGMSWKMKPAPGTTGKYQFYTAAYKASDYLVDGDELWVLPESMPNTGDEDEGEPEEFKAYVVNVDNTKFGLIDEEGRLVTDIGVSDFTVVRSGHRNMPTASMGSITTMLDPLYANGVLRNNIPDYTTTDWQQYRIINAAAIEYSDSWAAQCECRLPQMKFAEDGQIVFPYNEPDYVNDESIKLRAYNPYVYNVKGNWRPQASYAYLTARNAEANPNPRKTGYFKKFSAFYTYNATQSKWLVNKNGWTTASTVTQYSPYGFELENKDALDRYSSALYGYNFRFPVAVAANTRYRELASDGFEDYELSTCDTTSHFSFQGNMVPNKIQISSDQSHSGKKSLKLAPMTKTAVKKQIVNCAPE